MTERRKIQDINLPSSQRRAQPRRSKSAARGSNTKPQSARRNQTQAKGRSSRRLHSHSPIVRGAKQRKHGGTGVLWGVAFVLILALAYVVSLSLSQASVQVTLREQVVSTDIELTMYEDGVQDQLDFDTAVFSATASERITDVSDTEEVLVKASGSIMVYNDYSQAPQRLIEETRFEAANGQVYKLAVGDEIVVPGQTVVDGQTIPGSVEAVVYADQPGEAYNQDPTDFVIPGFRGGPKFEGFYARSVTPLSGGEMNTRPVLSDTERENVENALRRQLRTKVENEAKTQIPEGYLAITSGEDNASTSILYTAVEGGAFVAEQDIESSYIIVREEELTQGILAAISFDENERDRVMITNLSDLNYVVTSAESGEEITVAVSGDARIRWMIDDLVVRRMVAGTKKKDFNKILEGRDEIQSAQASIRPSWVHRLPKKTDQIEVFYTDIDS